MTREEIIRNLKYTMEKHKNDTVNTFGTNISVMCKDILDYLEQEPKTGHWITNKANQGGIEEVWYKCSECGWKNALLLPRNYCPNCGADMRGDKE